MYFWRIDALKTQLRQGPLAQRSAFAYLFISFLLLETAVGLPGLWNAEPIPATPWSWAAYVLGLAIFALGTVAAYRANAGDRGQDFAARYFALGWVLTIRLLVLVFLPLLVVLLLAVIVGPLVQPDAVGAATASDDFAADWGGEVIYIVFMLIFYWRLVHHFRDVATPASSRVAPLPQN